MNLEKLQKEIDDVRRKVKTETISMSVGEIMSKIKRKEIIFKETNIDVKIQSILMEKIFIGLEFPPVYIFQNRAGIWETLCNSWTLTTILNFYNNKFKLIEGEYIKSWKGLNYKDLTEKQKIIFRNKRIDFIIIDAESENIKKLFTI